MFLWKTGCTYDKFQLCVDNKARHTGRDSVVNNKEYWKKRELSGMQKHKLYYERQKGNLKNFQVSAKLIVSFIILE